MSLRVWFYFFKTTSADLLCGAGTLVEIRELLVEVAFTFYPVYPGHETQDARLSGKLHYPPSQPSL